MNDAGRATRSKTARSPFTKSQRTVIAVVIMGMASTSFPVTILSVSLPMIGRDVGMSPAGITWVVTAPLLANTVAGPVLGKIGDLYGHRRVFILGFAAATVFSLLTPLAWNGPALIGLRILGQACGAATGPSGMAILVTTVRREDRLRVISLWSLVSAISPTIGLVIGGPLIDAVGWRAVFVIPAIPAALCVIFSIRVVPHTERRSNVTFDVAGAATMGSGLLALMWGINRGGVLGWTHTTVLASIVVGLALLTLFVRVEGRATHPLLPLQVLTRRNVRWPLLAQPLVMGPYTGTTIVAPFLMEEEFGFGTGVITIVAFIRVATYGVFGGAAGRVGGAVGERGGAAIGTSMVVGAMALLAGSAVTGSLAMLMVGMLFTGGGAGFARPPFTTALTNAVDEHQLGVTSAAMNLTGQIGSSLGVTAMTAVMTATEGTHGYTVSFGAGAVFAVASLLCALRLEQPERSHPVSQPSIAQEPA